jgi:selenide,water dikinase
MIEKSPEKHTQNEKAVKLTAFSHGSGCGCKLSPEILEQMLAGNTAAPSGALLVGNNSRDDAAVYDLGNGQGLVATTDFFMPIVDDPFDFGSIAACNAISDVYAMGGRPALALALLGWPLGKIEPAVASRILEGARAMCAEAGIALAGGHSIDCPEPIFGLAVNGLIELTKVKRNDTARPGDLLFLTKPLGVGIFTTAQKRGLLLAEHERAVIALMKQRNSIGMALADLEAVHAMTDVTGFGLAGHLVEMCQGSRCAANISFNAIPKLTGLSHYLELKCTPGGTERNWKSYGHHFARVQQDQIKLIADPQTSGGLLIAVDPDSKEQIQEVFLANGLDAHAEPIGELGRIEAPEALVTIA